MRASVTWAIGIVLLIALAWGLEQVAYAPLETGDSYPPFSSMRADPLGTKALYESLAAMPGIEVSRLFKEERTISDPREAVFVLGVNTLEWSSLHDKEIALYEKLVENGGRLVIGFLPLRIEDIHRSEIPAVEKRWQVEMMYRARTDDTSTRGVPHETTLYFNVDPPSGKPAWRKLAFPPEHPEQASAIERDFGKGTIVLVADT